MKPHLDQRLACLLCQIPLVALCVELEQTGLAVCLRERVAFGQVVAGHSNVQLLLVCRNGLKLDGDLGVLARLKGQCKT